MHGYTSRYTCNNIIIDNFSKKLVQLSKNQIWYDNNFYT